MEGESYVQTCMHALKRGYDSVVGGSTSASPFVQAFVLSRGGEYVPVDSNFKQAYAIEGTKGHPAPIVVKPQTSKAGSVNQYLTNVASNVNENFALMNHNFQKQKETNTKVSGEISALQAEPKACSGCLKGHGNCLEYCRSKGHAWGSCPSSSAGSTNPNRCCECMDQKCKQIPAPCGFPIQDMDTSFMEKVHGACPSNTHMRGWKLEKCGQANRGLKMVMDCCSLE